MPDAGADAGAFDAGGLVPELCNGLDDDLDGLIDAWPDGGPLTVACPLTLGVCASAHSTCRDAGWTVCDYGPDYQLTERRCDGLDNDCDGTVDSSWTRTLLDADAGRFWALLGSDVEFAKVVPESAGHWLSLPNDLLIIDDDLHVTGRTQFPVLMNGHAYLFPNGGEWLRIANDYPVSGPPARVLFHRVFADAGFDVEADGGPRMVAEAVLPPWSGNFRAAPVDGGWAVVTKVFNLVNPVDPWTSIWMNLAMDGGLTTGQFDAGLVPLARQGWVSSHTDQFIFWMQTQAGTLEVLDADLASSSLRPRLSVSGNCWVATVVPLTVSCEPSPRRWLDEAGTVLLSSPTWRALGQHEDGDHLLAMSPAPGWDGGGPPASLLLGELQDGGVVQFLQVTNSPVIPYLRVHELGGRSVLVTWGDHAGAGVCPTCELGRFVARYACLPP